MSPSTTDQNEDVERPDLRIDPDEEHVDPEAKRYEEDRRGFFQKHPAAKPIVFLVAIVAVVLVGWFWWESRHWEDTDDAEIDGHIYPISARVAGQVVKVNYDDGQVVHKGDVLVQIDPTDYQVALARAQADYQDTQAQAQAAQFGVPVSSVGSFSQIRSASADMDSAQAGVTAAQKQAEAAQAQVQEAQADAAQAQYGCRALSPAVGQTRNLATAVRSGYSRSHGRQRNGQCARGGSLGRRRRR